MTQNKAISLFSGIGGLDIGFSKAGYNIIAQVEIDTFCQRVLKRHSPEWWPDSIVFTDVRRFGRNSIAGKIEVIFGGFPCQPHSVAGKRLGKADDRDLWPEFRRIIGEFRPRAVLLENVPGILTGYAVVIIADLTALGYDCRWGTIRASDTGSPHRRERWFCMAYNNGQRKLQQGRAVQRLRRRFEHSNRVVANAKYNERQDTNIEPIINNQQHNQASITRWTSGDCKSRSGSNVLGNTPRPRQLRVNKSRLGGATNGIPAWLDKPRWPAGQGAYQHEWEAPRTIGKGIDPNRASRIKALGNSVMPQIAYALAIEIRGLS